MEWAHEQLQLFKGAAVAPDLPGSVLHHVAQVLQVLVALAALQVSAGTNVSKNLNETQNLPGEPGPGQVQI